MKEIRPRSHINAKIRIPGSKSITHRALITAGLAQGETLLKEFLACEDTLHTVRGLRKLGIHVSIEKGNTTISGSGAKFSSAPRREEVFLGNSGTSYRLLLSIFALAHGEYILTGTPRMHQRPIGDLVRALNDLGAEVSCLERDHFPPVLIRADGIRGGSVRIPGGQSSQYVSSLLLSAPYAERDVEIEVTGKFVSRPYVDLTLEVMKAFGVPVDRDEYSYFRVSAGRRYRPCQFTIEGDMSSASYFWAAAAVTGGTVTTENIRPLATNQGDIALLDILEEMGCGVERKKDRVEVQGGPLSGIEVDLGSLPDMVPTLAAIALFAKGKTVIRNVSHLRLKESDRLRGIARELCALGGRVDELEDGIIIHGGEKFSGAVVDPHNDHRLAMSLAVVGLRVSGITIRNENCVNKSFPQFWELWKQL